MLLRYATLGFAIFSMCSTASADEDLVRLPGQGELKEPSEQVNMPERLVPGGGLLLSFDVDQNGEITAQEIVTGIASAFKIADSNEDNRITPLEQIKWVETLPTRDQSLANPARFDPNLDRSVRDHEFSDVILALASNYTDTTTGSITVVSLQLDAPITPDEEPFPDN